jgi:hypothetical protein
MRCDTRSRPAPPKTHACPSRKPSLGLQWVLEGDGERAGAAVEGGGATCCQIAGQIPRRQKTGGGRGAGAARVVNNWAASAKESFDVRRNWFGRLNSPAGAFRCRSASSVEQTPREAVAAKALRGGAIKMAVTAGRSRARGAPRGGGVPLFLTLTFSPSSCARRSSSSSVASSSASSSSPLRYSASSGPPGAGAAGAPRPARPLGPHTRSAAQPECSRAAAQGAPPQGAGRRRRRRSRAAQPRALDAAAAAAGDRGKKKRSCAPGGRGGTGAADGHRSGSCAPGGHRGARAAPRRRRRLPPNTNVPPAST